MCYFRRENRRQSNTKNTGLCFRMNFNVGWGGYGVLLVWVCVEDGGNQVFCWKNNLVLVVGAVLIKIIVVHHSLSTFVFAKKHQWQLLSRSLWRKFMVIFMKAISFWRKILINVYVRRFCRKIPEQSRCILIPYYRNFPRIIRIFFFENQA